MTVHEIDEKYVYNGELGAIYQKDRTEFKLWSPLAEEAKVILFDSLYESESISYTMSLHESGLWSVNIEEELEGKAYLYEVKIDEHYQRAVDPYAKAVTLNGEKGVIIDLNKTNPRGWHEQEFYFNSCATGSIIYELSVRDLSMDPQSYIQHKGKYLGLSEVGTRGSEGILTGLDHIKDLGVTHIQLLPIYDYGFTDESNVNPEYNWGYDPENYNVPEGSYSTDPKNPDTRIKELKAAIQAIHGKGLGVIMDVVYNHMYDAKASAFEQLVPGYFFRMDEDGNYKDESFCGNVIASENKMARRFIVDSVLYWAKEYHLDGFRFDLMGLLDIETMNEIRRGLDEINPSIIMLGEGWDMGDTLPIDQMANQKNMMKMPRIAHFNDIIRDGLKGYVFEENDKGFINGKEEVELTIKKGIVGGIHYNDIINSFGNIEPDQVVTYVEAHDNLTLWDKLKLTNGDVNREERRAMYYLAMAIILTSQGISFIHAGQELLRTKGGDENSYRSGDLVNQLDWQRKLDELETYNYMKGLIALRKAHPAFTMSSADAIKKYLEFLDVAPNVIAYGLKSYANGDKWRTIIVAFNANKESVKIDLPTHAEWHVVVNKEGAGIETLDNFTGDQLTLQPLEAKVIYR